MLLITPSAMSALYFLVQSENVSRFVENNASSAMKPALWRVIAYSLPGLPRPMMIFIIMVLIHEQGRGLGCRGGRIRHADGFRRSGGSWDEWCFCPR